MKIKILKNVTHDMAIHRAGTVVELKAADANHLIKGGFAEEHTKEESPQERNRQQLLKQYGKASREELEGVKASAEKVLAAEPGREDAKAVIEVANELLKKK